LEGIGKEKTLLNAFGFIQEPPQSEKTIAYSFDGYFLLHGDTFQMNGREAVSYFNKSARLHKKKGKFWFGFCLNKAIGIKKIIPED
jgi:hypothetical protein